MQFVKPQRSVLWLGLNNEERHEPGHKNNGPSRKHIDWGSHLSEVAKNERNEPRTDNGHVDLEPNLIFSSPRIGACICVH